MRGTLHELLNVGDAGQRIGDYGLFLGCETGRARDLFHVIAIGLGGRHTAGGGMRLLKEAGVGEVGHHVANGCGAESFAVGASEGARTDRLARGDEGLHDGSQNFAFAIPDIGVSRHRQWCQLSRSEQRPGGETASDPFYLTILDAEAWLSDQSSDPASDSKKEVGRRQAKRIEGSRKALSAGARREHVCCLRAQDGIREKHKRPSGAQANLSLASSLTLSRDHRPPYNECPPPP